MNWVVRFRREISWADLETERQQAVREVSEDLATGVLLISEPNPTYTFGPSAKPSDRVKTPATENIPEHAVSRGGKWTYHGPGQILLYPTVSLKTLDYPSKGVAPFLNDLRQVLSHYLVQLGVPCKSKDEPFGIYADERKIASFGIAVERGIVTHGVAIYLQSQKVPFMGIHPCGVCGAVPASIDEFAPSADWETVANGLSESIKKGFK